MCTRRYFLVRDLKYFIYFNPRTRQTRWACYVRLRTIKPSTICSLAAITLERLARKTRRSWRPSSATGLSGSASLRSRDLRSTLRFGPCTPPWSAFSCETERQGSFGCDVSTFDFEEYYVVCFCQKFLGQPQQNQRGPSMIGGRGGGGGCYRFSFNHVCTRIFVLRY